MRLKTPEETQADLQKCGVGVFAMVNKLEVDKKLEAIKKVISGDVEKPMSGDVIRMWMDVNQVLYAEGLLAGWKTAAIKRDVPSFKWDASGISSEFRALVIRANSELQASEDLADRLLRTANEASMERMLR